MVEIAPMPYVNKPVPGDVAGLDQAFTHEQNVSDALTRIARQNFRLDTTHFQITLQKDSLERMVLEMRLSVLRIYMQILKLLEERNPDSVHDFRADVQGDSVLAPVAEELAHSEGAFRKNVDEALLHF